MTRKNKFKRIRIFYFKLSSSKVFGFVVSMILLLALDLSLVPEFRLDPGPHYSQLMSSQGPSGIAKFAVTKGMTSGIPGGYFLIGIAVVEGLALAWLRKQCNRQAKKLVRLSSELHSSNTANQTKSLFLANTSHEIRTPLGAILGFTKLLQDPGLSSADREVYVSIIQKTGESLNSIINDILDLSKVEAGHLQVEKSWVPLSPLLEKVLNICEGKFGKDNVQVFLDYDKAVNELIYTDPVRLQQILVNVLGNALKFTEHGKIVLVIQQHETKLNFKIRDSGVGIRVEDQARLFQSFSQIENSLSEASEGTGLGLVLSRNLARLMGGELFLEYSRPGVGSSFVLSLPRDVLIAVRGDAKEDLPEELPKESSMVANSLAPGIDQKKVLLVDDSEINRLLMRRILHQQGLQVETANNGQEAVDLAMGGDYAALLMDVQMPIKNGHEAARELRQRGYDRPIIALTAHAMKEDRERCLEAGYSDYLSKPIQFEDLYSTLARVIDHHGPAVSQLDIPPGEI